MNKNFFQKCLSVELDLSLNELKVLIKFNSPNYKLNIFVNSLNEIQNYFQKEKIIFGDLSSKVANKFKEIYGLSQEEYEAKSQIDKKPKEKEIRTFDYGDEDTKPDIIIDIGTGYIKAGFSDEQGPRAVFPSIVGYPKFAPMNKGTYYIGEDASSKRSVLKLNNPIVYGVINNWDETEKIFEYIFNHELRVAPEEHNIILTESLNNTKKNREKMAEIMFESFNVAGLYIVKQAVLSLLSVGKSTGIVVDVGEGVTQFAPIFDYHCDPYGSIVQEIGGNDLNQYMMNLLTESGNRFSTSAEKEIARGIKEKSCYVALDFQEELKSVQPFDYELPDGTHIIIKDQRIRCPEALFDPSMIDKSDFMGIGEACNYSIQRCDCNLRKDLYNCIILSGGSSMFEGLPERLTKEIKCLAPESMKEEVNIIASPERKFAVSIGGYYLSSISSFESGLITKTEYEENGATIVDKKYF